jgi:ParB-like nuclease domain
MSTSALVYVDRIVTDSDSQARVKIHAGVVKEYAKAMTERLPEGGVRFPPIVLFTDNQNYWLADGFHRVLAARQAGLTQFAAEIRAGARRDALLYSIFANSAHGLPRTNADKRKAVGLLLADPEWSQWSDREIGRRCQVDNKLVARLRHRACEPKPQMRLGKLRAAEPYIRGGLLKNPDLYIVAPAPGKRT